MMSGDVAGEEEVEEEGEERAGKLVCGREARNDKGRLSEARSL